MPYELPADPRSARRARITGWIGFGFAAVLVALLAYLGYVGYEGSRQMTDPPSHSADCRTPATFGWEYEAIGYDSSTDEALAAEPDPTACGAQGSPADGELAASDGVPLAGWYVPAASGIGPEGPTVVLAHGWGSNKSALLDRAAILHDDFNLVLFDFRNHGQSGRALTTQGVREASDMRAVVDWLVEAKNPAEIAVFGVSMGGATGARFTAGDERISALVLDSTHATIVNAAERRLARAGYPLSLPGSWAILMGSLLRTGLDLSEADAIQSVARLDERPVLLIGGGLDDSLGAEDAADLLEAATEAGSAAELHVCEAAGHAAANRACADDYPDWVLGFLDRTIGR